MSPLKLNCSEAVKRIWRGLVPYKVEIFLWMAILGELNTKAKLYQLRIATIDDP